MNDPLVVTVGVLCAFLFVLVVLAAWWARRRQRRRLQQIQDWADRHGWAFARNPAVAWTRRLPGGHTRGVSVLLSGTVAGRRVHVAEYEVTDVAPDGTGGTSPQSHHYVVTVVTLSRPFPEITVTPRRGRRKTDFDHAFKVSTSHPQAVSRWRTPPLMAAHLAGHVPTPWSVQGTDLLHHATGRLSLDDVERAAASLAYLAGLLDPPPNR